MGVRVFLGGWVRGISRFQCILCNVAGNNIQSQLLKRRRLKYTMLVVGVRIITIILETYVHTKNYCITVEIAASL